MISKEKIKEMQELQKEVVDKWSEEEVADLKKCMELGFTPEVIHRAGVFNRTKRAINNKMTDIRKGENDAEN